MSAKCSGKVWEQSQHKGSELLLLLAIADHAKDDGSGAWPSIASLAAKTRLSERNIRYLLRKLEESGELMVSPGAGPHGTNLYSITLQGGKLCRGEKIAGGQTSVSEGGKPASVTPAIAIAPKPSVKPSVKPSLYAAPKKKRTAAPDVFPVTDDLEVWAKGVGFRGDRKHLEAVTANFLDHHAAKGTLFLDWRRSWQTWIRNSVNYGQDLPSGGNGNETTNGKGPGAAYSRESGAPRAGVLFDYARMDENARRNEEALARRRLARAQGDKSA